MKSLIAITLPVWLFVAQAWFSFVLELTEVQNLYIVFLAFYFLSSAAAFATPACRSEVNTLTPTFGSFAKAFVFLKVILTTYFFLIFANYVARNGYANIREYMTSEAVQSSPFYVALLMYIDAYIVYPLNYIVLVALYLKNNKRLFFILLSCIVLHTAVFYASRIIFYNIVILALFGAVHKRLPIVKVLAAILVSSIVALAASSLLLYQRDVSFQYGGSESFVDVLLLSVVNYHVIPPLILDAISRDSAYFNSNAGYGLATFGFLADPLISLIPIGDVKSLMASKVLSAEAQAFTLNIDGAEYNAFTTFLYSAVFDFGRVAGPAIYGAFFGFSITRAFRRRDAAGLLAFVILSYFVYFNSFTFFITGDWFWVFVFIAVFFARRPRVRHSAPAPMIASA